MDVDTATKDDTIEDCSEGEGDATSASMPPLSATHAPPGVAGRFASYLGARHSEGDQRPDVSDFAETVNLQAKVEAEVGHGASQTFEAELDEWVGAPAKAETLYDKGDLQRDSAQKPLAEDEAFLEEVHINQDGTLTGGPTTGDDLEEFRKLASGAGDDTVADAPEALPAAEDDASSDAEGADGGMPGAPDEPPLPEEAWKDRPLAERELWERVRPRALRREAARVRELKLPTAAVNRLMRVHPDLQTKSSEALEVINCATVLLLQAMGQATVRGRKAAGHTVRLEDVKQVCLNNRELHFLLPLSATLDASALAAVARQDEADDGNEDGVGRAAGSSRVVAAAPGQSTLSSATFARTATAKPQQPQVETKPAPETDADALDIVTVQGNLESKAKTPIEKHSNKRKLPQSAKKAANKAPRQSGTAHEKALASLSGGGPSIASFFKRSETS